MEFVTDGTPWGKYYFKKQAEEYFKQNYVNEQVIDIEVGYDFKAGHYKADFYTKSGKEISVSVSDDNQLESYRAR